MAELEHPMDYLPGPDDPALRAAVETLRELPPDNPEAVQTIVAAAVANQRTERSFVTQPSARYWRPAAAVVAASLLFAVGLMVGRQTDSNSRSLQKNISEAAGTGPLASGTFAATQTVNQTSGNPEIREAALENGVVPTTFRINAPHASAVSVVGDFNGWNPSTTPLRRTIDGHAWIGAVPLQPGRHTYAFVIDGVVTPDPNVSTVRDLDYDVPVSAVIVGEP